MTEEEYTEKHERFVQLLNDAKFAEEDAEIQYNGLKEAFIQSGASLTKARSKRLFSEQMLRDLEWQYKNTDSPECTGTEY